MIDQKYINLILSPKGNSVNIRKEPNTQSPVLFTAVGAAGRTTGDTEKKADGTWLKITLYKSYSGQSWGWARADVIKLSKPAKETVSEAQGQKLINDLVRNDIEIHAGLLRITPLIEALQKKGKVPANYNNTYNGLVQRLAKRQEKLKNSKILEYKQGIKKGYQDLVKGFKIYLLTQGINIFGNRIGALPIVAVVIGAVAGAGLAVAAYFAFKPDYDESKQDLIITKELELALSKLTPEQAQKLKTDLEKQVDKAFYSGETEGKFSNLFSIGKYIVLFVAGYFVVNAITKNKEK